MRMEKFEKNESASTIVEVPLLNYVIYYTTIVNIRKSTIRTSRLQSIKLQL